MVTSHEECYRNHIERRKATLRPLLGQRFFGSKDIGQAEGIPLLTCCLRQSVAGHMGWVRLSFLHVLKSSSERDNVRVIRAAKPVCRRMTERGKVLNPEYNIFRDQPIAGVSPLRINTLLSRVL